VPRQRIIDIDLTHAQFDAETGEFVVSAEDVERYEEDRDPPDHDQWLRQIERVQEETGWKDIDLDA
jgi:hypothetical protein